MSRRNTHFMSMAGNAAAVLLSQAEHIGGSAFKLRKRLTATLLRLT